MTGPAKERISKNEKKTAHPQILDCKKNIQVKNTNFNRFIIHTIIKTNADLFLCLFLFPQKIAGCLAASKSLTYIVWIFSLSLLSEWRGVSNKITQSL